jgi:cysteinyl-tRNA synthetase
LTSWENRFSPPPAWIEEENPDWPGNYKVRYWMEEWQRILMGRDDSCLDRIMDAGFDGVYLDIIDAFWYFEAKAGVN